MKKGRRGNCYCTCESLWYLLGGMKSHWRPAYMYWEGDTHWYLRKKVYYHIGGSWEVLDPTASQFDKPPTFADYDMGKGCGFLTSRPSKKARVLMEKMLWQDK